MYKPGWLVAFCVFAIALGSMGLMSGFWQAGGALVGGAIADWITEMQPPVPNQQLEEIEDQIMEESMAMNARYKWVLFGMGCINVIISGLLLISGILTLQLKPVGRKLLSGVFVAAAIFECVAIVPKSMVQNETSAIQQKYLGQIMESSPPPGAAPPPQAMTGMMTTVAKVTASVIIAMGISWAIAKAVALLGGFFYLRRPMLQPLFEPSAQFTSDRAENVKEFDDLAGWDEKQP